MVRIISSRSLVEISTARVGKHRAAIRLTHFGADTTKGGSNCLGLSSTLNQFCAPEGPMFEHRIQDNQQFPHAGRQGDLLCLASRTEALIERTDHGIEACGDHRGHVQRRPDLRPAAPDRAFPAPRADITDSSVRSSLCHGDVPRECRIGIARSTPGLGYPCLYFSGTTLDLSTEPRESSSVVDCLTTVFYERTSSMEDQRMPWQKAINRD